MKKHRYRFREGEEIRTRYTVWVDDLEIPAETLLPILDLTRDEALVEFEGQSVWVKRTNLKPDTTPSMFPEMDPAKQLTLM